MRRRRRGQQLSLSLLDTMTCGLGAVILLFILRQEVQQSKLKMLEQQSSMVKEEIAQVGPATSHATDWMKKAEQRFSAAVGNGVLGLPPLEGDVFFLVDVSLSVTESPEKVALVVQYTKALLATNKGISAAAAGGFTAGADDPFEIVPWMETGSEQQQNDFQSALLICLQKGSPCAKAKGTDLRTAVAGAIKIGLQRGACTIVLITDGMGNEEVNMPAASIIKEIGERSAPRAQTRSIRIHAIGILGYKLDALGVGGLNASLGDPFNVASQGGGDRNDALTYALQAITFSYDGVLLFAPVEIP